MAIKAGQIISVGNGAVLIDRIQSAGPGTLNVPVETIYELGNYKSVGQVRDIPDLSFALESYDVSLEIEALLLGVDPTDSSKLPYDFALNQPLDMKSVFKAPAGSADLFAAVDSVGLPYLSLETMQYRFGLRDDARQTATLRGDSIFYNPGSTYIESTTGTNTANQTVVTTHPAYGVTEGGITRRVLSVSAGSRRLLYGVDYTEASGTVTAGAAVATLTILAAVPTTSKIRIIYSSPTVEEFPQTVHADTTVKPAAIRGRDIAVYLGGYSSGSPGTNRLLGVQAATAEWRVTLNKDEEFGNYHIVSQDFDIPNVTGTVQVKPSDPAAFVALMQKVAGVSVVTESAPATAAPIIPLDIVLHDPVSGAVLKHISVPDARFTVPGFSARVQQKLDVTINFTSDQGSMLVSNA